MRDVDVCVIGGGPAGLAAAIAAVEAFSGREGVRGKVLLLEREERLGGILKQCIHDGFGMIRFGEKLTGPEYAQRFIQELAARDIECLTHTFLSRIESIPGGFRLVTVMAAGMETIRAGAVILATGCRERTAKQVFIHGTRPAGIFTAGTAQYFVNLLGEMPARRCVILGSGDIGLIMARRLTLEGAQVLGVYEAKSEPSGLTRNMVQCLEDFHIPLYLSHTVTRVFGEERLTGVEIARVDEAMHPIAGSQRDIDCDTLVLSVGLIPENEIAVQLGIRLDPVTAGPVCDSRFMTQLPGVFACGNCLHVNDLADYVTESGELAGQGAAAYVCAGNRKESDGCGDVRICVRAASGVQYVVPQEVVWTKGTIQSTVFYYRSRHTLEDAELRITLSPRRDRECMSAADTYPKEIYRKKYRRLRPPEMVRVELSLKELVLDADMVLEFDLKGGSNE